MQSDIQVIAWLIKKPVKTDSFLQMTDIRKRTPSASRMDAMFLSCQKLCWIILRNLWRITINMYLYDQKIIFILSNVQTNLSRMDLPKIVQPCRGKWLTIIQLYIELQMEQCG